MPASPSEGPKRGAGRRLKKDTQRKRPGLCHRLPCADPGGVDRIVRGQLLQRSRSDGQPLQRGVQPVAGRGAGRGGDAGRLSDRLSGAQIAGGDGGPSGRQFSAVGAGRHSRRRHHGQRLQKVAARGAGGLSAVGLGQVRDDFVFRQGAQPEKFRHPRLLEEPGSADGAADGDVPSDPDAACRRRARS